MNTIFSLGRYFYHFFIGELIKFRWGLGSLKYRWGVGKIRWGPVSLGVLQRGVQYQMLINTNKKAVLFMVSFYGRSDSNKFVLFLFV